MGSPSLFNRGSNKVPRSIGARIRGRLSRLIAPILDRDALPEPIETIDVGVVTVRMFSPGRLTRQRAKSALTKDPEMIRWLDQLSPPDVLWDIGANIGIYSLYAAINRGCQVFAFEPGAANYFVLNRNIELNSIQDLVSAFCVAVAQTSGFGSLNMKDTKPGSSHASFGAARGPRGEIFRPKFKQAMISYSLDDLAKQLPQPTHIKIDVDGIELSILSGGSSMLKSGSLRSLIVELDPKRPSLLAETKALLGAHGLRFSHSYDPQWEHIFVR